MPITPPAFTSLLLGMDPERLSTVLSASGQSSGQDAEYVHWDKLIHLSPPDGLTLDEWWLQLKLRRSANRRDVPLLDLEGHPFTLSLPDAAAEMLHTVDQRASGRIRMAESVMSPSTRDRYILSSLIEEAITSSQLEGASTTRRVAKDMLRTGRAPTDRSERMIVNNYQAMQYVSANRAEPMTPQRLFELHRIVTMATLDDPSAAGRLQRPDDVRVRVWGDGDQVLHSPPPASDLVRRLEVFCAFANGDASTGWVHPVVRALVLHFWLGFDHYFEDGNGRTARAVFYWSMLRQDYWLTEFLTISSILRSAPIAYAQSFLQTETDDNDLTYFVLHHLRVLTRALDSLEEYLERKVLEVREVEALMRGSSGLNHRQRALIGTALRDGHGRYTIQGHQAAHGVVYQTARTDLLELEARGLLIKRREGKSFRFEATADISQRLRDMV